MVDGNNISKVLIEQHFNYGHCSLGGNGKRHHFHQFVPSLLSSKELVGFQD